MAVYFEPRSNRMGVGDYIGNALTMLLGNGLQRGQNAQQYELGQRAENEAMARKQADRDMVLNQLGYTTGGGMDVRGNPNAAFAQIAGMQHLVPGLDSVGLTNALFPKREFQQIDRGGQITAGSYDPSTGDFNAQDYGITMNPNTKYVSDTQRYVADQGLAGHKVTAGANVEAARERNRVPVQHQQITDANGNLILLNPQDGRQIPTGINVGVPQQKNDLGGLANFFKINTVDETGQPIPDMEWVPGFQKNIADYISQRYNLPGYGPAPAQPAPSTPTTSNQLPTQPTERPMGWTDRDEKAMKRAVAAGMPEDKFISGWTNDNAK